MKTSRTLIALAAAASLTGAATAHADSVAYIKGGDVYLITPDGSRQFQVTSGGGYNNVSQADDGTLLATTVGTSHLQRLDRSGKVLSDIAVPVSDHSDGPRKFQGPFDADLSPDGKTAAYGYIVTGLFDDGDGNISADTRDGAGFTQSNVEKGFTDDGYKHSNDWEMPEFVDNTHVVLSNGPQDSYDDPVAVETVGSGDPVNWFTDPTITHPMEATVSRNNLAIALVAGLDRTKINVYRDTDGKLGGTPGQQPNVAPCFTYTDSNVSTPTFNKDGSIGFWSSDKGIQSAPFDIKPDDCGTAVDSKTIAPGGTSPDWGPADVPPARQVTPNPKPTPQPTTTPGPNPTATPGPVAVSCKVPALRGQTLASARKRLVNAHCALGKVTHKRGRKGRVLKAKLVAGKVTLVVGRKR